MRKQLLLAATLGALAITPAPASAHDPVHPNVVSSFGVHIIVRDGPKVVHHRHQTRRHLRAQPWPRYFNHHAPAWRWQGPRHHRPRHFGWRNGDHGGWWGAPRGQHHGDGGAHFKHGQTRHWGDAPRHRGRPSLRSHFRQDGFERNRPRSDGHRRRD